MRKSAIITAALFGAFFSSAVQADDIISRFTVREQGQFAVDAGLSGSRSNSSYSSRYAPGFSAEQREYESRAIFGGNVGLGYGFELFADLPYVLRNHVESRYVYQGNRASDNFDGGKGFSDVMFGLKYRAFRSADSSNEVLLRLSALHHSSSSGFVDGEVSYLHAFTPDIKTALSANFTKRQGGSDSVGYGAYLIWQASQQIAIVPFIRGERFDGYEDSSSFNSASAGIQLRYTPVKGWNITPGLSGTHIGKRNANSGTLNSMGGSLILQKEF